MPTTRRITASLLIIALTGCPLTPEVIGDTLTTTAGSGDGESLGAGTTTAGGDGSTTVITGSTGAGEDLTGATTESSGVYGSFCELADLSPPLLSPVSAPQPLCEGDICVLVADPPFACSGDDECVEEKGEGSQCDAAGWCTETDAFLQTNTRCTQACETIADCPAIPGCATGLTCAPGTMIGPLCCQKMCLCNDHLDKTWVTSVQQNCDNDPDMCSD